MEKKNIYEAKAVSKEEEARQKGLAGDRLFTLSTQAIGEVEGKTVLDVGAGMSTALGAWVKQRGGEYIAFDIQEGVIREHAQAGHVAIQGDIAQAIPVLPTADIVHVRLVLMHLIRQKRNRAIEEVFRAAKERCLFIEPDWTEFCGNAVVNRLRDLAIRILGQRMDLYLGRTLFTVIANVLPMSNGRLITEKRLPPESKKDYRELVQMTSALKSNAVENMTECILATEEIALAIAKEAQKDNRAFFTPPRFTLVEVKKGCGQD